MSPVLNRICSASLTSWPVLVVVVCWSVILNVLAAGSTASGALVVRGAFAALAGLAAYLAVAGAWRLVLFRLKGRTRIAATFAVLLLAGAVRGAVLQALLIALGLTSATASTSVVRLVSSLFTIPVAFVLTSGMVESLRSYRASASALVAEQKRLSAMLDESARGIERRQREAIDRLRGELEAQVRSLPTESAPQTAVALEGLVGNVVRPLSHSLARELPTWEPPIDETPPRVSWIDVWRRPDVSSAIQPTVLAATMVILAVPAAVLIYSPQRGLISVTVGVAVLWALLEVGRRLLLRWAPRRPVGIWLSVTAVLVASGLGATAAIRVVEQGDQSQGALSVTGLVAIPAFGLITSTIAMMGTRMRESTRQLEELARSLRWHLARVSAQRWEQSGRLSRALHGPVQSLLYAAMLRLRQGFGQGNVDPGTIDDLSRELSTALVQSVSVEATTTAPGRVLADIAATWRGVADVTWSMDAGVERDLTADPLCSRLVVDLAGEAVSNAVRHGSAVSVTVAITRPNDDIVELRVVDDGVVPPAGGAGLGTQQLRSCTVESSLTLDPTTLRALLPYARA